MLYIIPGYEQRHYQQDISSLPPKLFLNLKFSLQIKFNQSPLSILRKIPVSFRTEHHSQQQSQEHLTPLPYNLLRTLFSLSPPEGYPAPGIMVAVVTVFWPQLCKPLLLSFLWCTMPSLEAHFQKPQSVAQLGTMDLKHQRGSIINCLVT